MKINSGRAPCLSFLLALSAANASHAQTKEAAPITNATWEMAGKWNPPATSPILITVEVVDVHPSVMDKFVRSFTNGPDRGANILEELLKSQVNEATIIRVQTRNDVTGVASYDKVVGFTSHDKASPGKAFVTLETSLTATPHIEGNHTISVKLKTTVTQISSEGIPNTIGRGITLPQGYFLNGLTEMYPGQPLDGKGKLAKANNPQALEEVSFVTVTVLPITEAVKQPL